MAFPRPRLSLLTALLLTTIIAMAIANILLWREVAPLRLEVQRLRMETGHLTIDDPTKAYAISVPTFEEDTWKWRVYLPPEQSYTLHERSGTFSPATRSSGADGFKAILKEGVGSSSSSSGLQGEFILTAKLEKEDDRWLLVTRALKRGPGGTSSSGGTTSIWQPSGDWLSDRRGRMTTSGVSAKQRAFGTGEPILLFQMTRPTITEFPGGGHRSEMPTGPADGFALWIEQGP